MAEVIIKHGRRPSDGDNVGLWMDKLVHRHYAPGSNDKTWKLNEEVRRFSLQQFCRTWKSKLGETAAARLGETVAQLHGAQLPHQNMLFRSGIAKPQGRLLVGGGGAAATETSITFHPIWGVPIIPGSALKGIARAELATQVSATELEEIFGTTDRAGLVTFYDAVPARGEFTLALDGQTPHHGSYYGTAGDSDDSPDDESRTRRRRGHEPRVDAPTDADSPVPFSFLTVVKTEFAVHVGASVPRSDEQNDVARARALSALKKACGALTATLAEMGVGGKTSAGYGRFTLDLDLPTKAKR